MHLETVAGIGLDTLPFCLALVYLPFARSWPGAGLREHPSGAGGWSPELSILLVLSGTLKIILYDPCWLLQASTFQQQMRAALAAAQERRSTFVGRVAGDILWEVSLLASDISIYTYFHICMYTRIYTCVYIYTYTCTTHEKPCDSLRRLVWMPRRLRKSWHPTGASLTVPETSRDSLLYRLQPGRFYVHVLATAESWSFFWV